MIEIFKVSSRFRNEAVYPDPQWESRADLLRCRSCRAVLREYVSTDPELVLEHDPESGPLRGSIIGVMRTSWTIVRGDFAEFFRLTSEGFKLYPVMSGGSPLKDYMCVSQPYEARLFQYTKRVLQVTFCRGCGRLCMCLDGNAPTCIWAPSLHDVGSVVGKPEYVNRKVFTGIAGVGFYVTAQALQSIPSSLQRDLKIVKVEVGEHVAE